MSPTVLEAQRAAWDSRPLLRRVYEDWFRLIDAHLARVPGDALELGCGIGAYSATRPVIATDVVRTPWADEVMDAHSLPYKDGSLANIVMLDVLHHLQAPVEALREAERVLRNGGRVVLVEPYCSPLSGPVYRRFHHERTDLCVDPFDPGEASGPDPFDGNQALPTLLFFRQAERLRVAVPGLRIVRRARFAVLAYPLSGGFSRRQLVPSALAGPLIRLDRLASAALGRLAGFRCLVVLEKG